MTTDTATTSHAVRARQYFGLWTNMHVHEDVAEVHGMHLVADMGREEKGDAAHADARLH